MIWPAEDAYDSIFKAAGARNTVNPALLKGISAAESSFNPNSHREEPQDFTPGVKLASFGLMQVTQESARLSGWPKGQDYETLFDPAVNIEYGAREIARYLKNPRRNVGPKAAPFTVKTVNTVPDAVAAYNAGYPREIKATTPRIAFIYGYPIDYRGVPPPGWVYANQPYVDRVMAYTAYFTAKFAGNQAEVERLEGEIKKKDFRAWCIVAQCFQFPYYSSSADLPGGFFGSVEHE